MTFTLNQPSFASGEIAPSLWARTDQERYQTAAKKLVNFIVRPHGGIEKRGGSYFVGEVKNSAKPSRLFRFQFSSTQGYALEFADKVMRVISEGGYVVNEDDGTAYELEIPYSIEDVWELNYEQSADVIFLTHPLYEPRMLKRYDHTDWRLETMVFSPQTPAPTGLSSSETGDEQFKVTAINEKTGEESLPVLITGAATTTTLQWNKVEGCKKYSIYRRSAGMFGWIATIIDESGPNAKVTFKSADIKPDYDVTPPTSRNPFDGSGNYPSTAAIYEQRMCMAATLSDSELVEMSKSSNYNNFTMSNPLLDDDAISVRAAGQKVNTVYHFIPLSELLILTQNGIWKASNGGDSPYLSPKSIKLKPQNQMQCHNLKPIIIGNTALYYADRRIRTLGYSLEVDGYDGVDISIFASHLFENKQIIDWTYCGEKNLILMVLNTGELVALTFMKEHKLYAFTRFQTAGSFESIVAVQERQTESVYATIKREINGQIKRYVERFVISQKIEDRHSDYLFLDCAVSAKFENPVSSIQSGLEYLEGQTVAVFIDGGFQGLKTVINGGVELNIPGKDVKIGLPYEALLRTLDIDYPTDQLTSTAQGKLKKVSSVTLCVENSGIFEVAAHEESPSMDSKLKYIKYGQAPDLMTEYVKVDLYAGFTKNAEVFVRSAAPYPLIINTILPEIVHGG